MQTSEQNAQLLNYVNIVCTPFSLAGAFYMIISFFKSRSRSFSGKLVLCLAISDLLLSICDAYAIFVSPQDQDCAIMGFLRIAGIYSNMIWITQILSVLYVQFALGYAGVHRLFPYLVVSNILCSLTPSLITLFEQTFNVGELTFEINNGECFLGPDSALLYVLEIPFGILLALSCFFTIKVYSVFRSIATSLGNIEYKQLFMYPAVLFLFNVPISIDNATGNTIFPLTFACMVMFKSIGFINALQFRRATNSRIRMIQESQKENILGTLGQDGESSFDQ
jgi:hypothetical protein